MKHNDGQRNVVLVHLANQNAFIDRLVLNVWGDLSLPPGEFVTVVSNRAVGSKGSKYARCIDALVASTGNPVQFLYGVMPDFGCFKGVPPMRLTHYSKRSPITMAQTLTAARSFVPSGLRIQVSEVELTFNLTGYSIDFFRRHLLTRAKTVSQLIDSEGWETLYFGAPASAWRVRVYQKLCDMVRLELVLRRESLRDNGIEQLNQIGLLSGLDVWTLIYLRDLIPEQLEAVRSKLPKTRRWIIPWWFAHRGQIQIGNRVLRKGGFDTGAMFRGHPVEDLLRGMLRKLIW